MSMFKISMLPAHHLLRSFEWSYLPWMRSWLSRRLAF